MTSEGAGGERTSDTHRVGSRLLFVSGKGGTGKSAVAAALAIDAARRGSTVLAVDMEGSPGLGEHLRWPDLRYTPVETRPGLWAMSMDRPTALDEYLKLQLHVPLGAPTRQIAGALTVLADTAPGVREIISIGKPVYETWRGMWDIVIVDAPSLGQFQSYLRAPATIAELVPTGNVRRQAAKLAATLRNPDTTSVVLVTTPAELPVRETSEAVAILERESLSPRPTVVMNRTLAPSGISGTDITTMPTGSARDAALLQVTMEGEQDIWSRSLPHRYRLPLLRGVVTPGEVSIHLSDALEVRA
jgi:anion-transporting  ArsA/GET3 family ATPase